MANLPGLTINAPPDGPEGTTFSFKVSKVLHPEPECSVDWRVSGDVDTADFIDGQPLAGRLTIPANVADGFIDLVTTIDAAVEVSERLVVELFNPLGAVLLRQPAHGKIEISDTYEVTYTPAPGFTGTDTFDYLARNSDGQVASSTITVEVKTPTVPHFVNNYRVKIAGFVAPDSEVMTGFELLFDIVDPRLKHTSFGGVVADTGGRDIRLEDGVGNVVPYARLRYNQMSGRVVGIAKRDRATGSTWNNLEIYAGKVGPIVEEANPGTALSALLACWRLDTGIDIAKGRNLTPAGAGITLTTLFEEPAASFDRAVPSDASLTDPSLWLNGLTAFTLSMDLLIDQIALDSGVFRTGGASAAAVDKDCTITVRPDNNSFAIDPPIANIWFAMLKIGATLCRIQTAADTCKVGVPTTFALAWQSGQSIAALSDDALLTLAYNEVATPTGALSVPGGPLSIAGGPRGNFDGKVGLVRLAATRRSNAWIRAEQRNRLYPKALLAWGEAVGPNDTASCVAFPSTDTATGPDKTLSPLGNDTGTGLTIVAVASEVGADVTIVGPANTTLLYKQKAGFAGVDHVSYTIQDSLLRKSSSIITVTVSGTTLKVVDDAPTDDIVARTPTTIAVQANDEGVGRKITSIGALTNGSTAVKQGPDDDTATILYTAGPAPFYGFQSFTYTVTDSAGQTRQGTVSVTVKRPPIAAAAITGAAMTAGNTAGQVISPLADPTTIGVGLSLPSPQTFVPVPAFGTAALFGTNQIKYIPPATIAAATDVSFEYTIQDSYAQTTKGTITIRVNPVAVVVDARPDNTYAAVTAGTGTATLSPSPLGNDTLDGVANAPALTIQALPGSGAGSAGGTFARVSVASVANKGISYTPPASVTAPVNDTITYTISDGAGHTDSALITVPVNPVAVPGRPERPAEPTAAKTITVGYAGPTNSKRALPDTIAGALAMATAGDHIFLDNKVWPGDITINKSVAAANPIVIRSRSMTDAKTPGATLGGLVTVSGTAQGIWFHQLTFNNSFDQLVINGPYVSVTRCWFRDNGTISNLKGDSIYIPSGGGANNIKIGYCRFTARNGQNNIHLNLPDPLTATNHAHHTAIYNNYFWDNQYNDTNDENHVIYFGDTHITSDSDLGCMVEVYVEENYIENGNGRTRQIYLKRACRLIRNRARGRGIVGFRHGLNGFMYGNRVEGTECIFTVHAGGCDIRNNDWSGSSGECDLSAGGCAPWGGDVKDYHKPIPQYHQAGDNCLFVNNTGTIYCGQLNSSFKLQPTYLRPQLNDNQPDGAAGGKLNGVHVWEHKPDNSTINTTKYSGNIVSGGVTKHTGTYPGSSVGIPTIVPAGWDGNNTGFKTGSNQGSAT